MPIQSVSSNYSQEQRFGLGVKSDPQTKLCSHQWGVVINQWGEVNPPLPPPDKSNTE